MNIRNNIVNYLSDREYVICTYENHVYVFKYNNLDSFSDKKIVLSLDRKNVIVSGNDLIIVKITKEEILIRGVIRSIEMTDKNE